MIGKTHQVGGELGAVLGFFLLRENGLLLSDASPYLQLLAMYPFALWGAKAVDLDKHGESLPAKDIVSVTISKLLHLTYKPYKKMKDKLEGDALTPLRKRKIRKSFWFRFCRFANASHRSWQTHSDLTLITLVAVIWWLFNCSTVTSTNLVLLYIMLVGVGLGMISHLILDALTTEGIPLVVFRIINLTILGRSKVQLPERLHLVPRGKAFSCESAWEDFIRKLLRVLTVVSVVYLVVVIEDPNLPYKVIERVYSLIR